MDQASLHLRCPADSRYVAPVRHALAAFLRAVEFERQMLEDATTAAGEALANIVEHAYGRAPKATDPYLELKAELDPDGKLSVVVSDGGSFIQRPPVHGRGFGLRIIRAISDKLRIDTSNGTHITMTFQKS